MCFKCNNDFLLECICWFTVFSDSSKNLQYVAPSAMARCTVKDSVLVISDAPVIASGIIIFKHWIFFWFLLATL